MTELKIEVLRTGEGEKAEPGDVVSVHYTGWLEDGTQFDSSLERGEPIEFPLGAGMVIPGWEQGLAGMKVGEKRRLRIPPELAYGDSGAGGVIPPGATLVFEVELVGVRGDGEPQPEDDGGLEIETLREGSGPEVRQGDVVSVHYTGWLEDGTQFDSSLERGEPIEFPLGAGMVIPGWERGLIGMKVGEKRRLRIPPQLAYGDSGAGGVIPPGATLVFEVELMGLQAQS